MNNSNLICLFLAVLVVVALLCLLYTREKESFIYPQYEDNPLLRFDFFPKSFRVKGSIHLPPDKTIDAPLFKRMLMNVYQSARIPGIHIQSGMGGTTQDNSIHIRLVRRVSNIPSPLFIASPDFSPPLEMRKQGTPVNFADFYGNSELFPDVIVPKDTWGDLYFWDYRLASVELDNGTIFTPAYERSYIHSVGPKYKYNLSDLTASGAIVKLVFERG